MAHRPARHEAANALEVTPERSRDSTRTGPRALPLGLEPQAGLHDEGLERVIDDLAAHGLGALLLRELAVTIGTSIVSSTSRFGDAEPTPRLSLDLAQSLAPGSRRPAETRRGRPRVLAAPGAMHPGPSHSPPQRLWAHHWNGDQTQRCDVPVLAAGSKQTVLGAACEPPSPTAPLHRAGRRLQGRPRLVAQRGGEPIAQPLGDVAAV